MAAHTERIERFNEAIYKQREKINERMTEVFILLKEYTKGKSPEKVLVREEVSKPITNYVNVISLVRIENEKDRECVEVIDKIFKEQINIAEREKVADDVEDGESDGSMNENSTRWGKYADRLTKIPRSRPIGYYVKHEINKKTIKDLVDNHKYNDSLLATRLGKMDNETYKSLPVGPMYVAILKKKLVRKNKGEGNFVIACSIGRLKYMNALADQGSDVNIMPLTIYNKLTNKKPVRTNIRLSLANHSYVYPLGIAEDVLEEVAGHNFFIYDHELEKEGSSASGEGVT
ncbi:hypothetical protein Tco_1393317 [Tanacetum coccineum]